MLDAKGIFGHTSPAKYLQTGHLFQYERVSELVIVLSFEDDVAPGKHGWTPFLLSTKRPRPSSNIDAELCEDAPSCARSTALRQPNLAWHCCWVTVMHRGRSRIVGVTETTVRSQIKSVFSKTGVKRQGELIRLLLSYSGPTIQGTQSV